MEVVANYNQPPPGVPQVTGPPPGYKPADLSRISPKEAEKRARERGFGSLENSPRDRWGRAIGATAGVAAGLATGNPLTAITLGTTGYRLGDNAARGIANLRRPQMDISSAGVPAITPPLDIPVSQPATGGIFGRGMRGQKAQGILAAVASGAMSIKDAAAVSGMSESRIRDSLGSMSGGGMGQSWGGGNFYGGDHSGYSSGGFHGGAINPNR
jgi:hypothetical protein